MVLAERTRSDQSRRAMQGLLTLERQLAAATDELQADPAAAAATCRAYQQASTDLVRAVELRRAVLFDLADAQRRVTELTGTPIAPCGDWDPWQG